MSEYVEVMNGFENDILTDEEQTLEMHSAILNDNTNGMSVGDEYDQDNNSFSIIGD